MRARHAVPAALAALAFLAGRLTSQEEDALDPAEMQRDMIEMMRLAEPGEEHELLERLEGEWTVTTRAYMPPMPGVEEQPPMVSKGTATGRMILGGRFLLQESKGTFMGQVVESLGIFGFDRRDGVFTNVGFDTLGTYFVTSRGHRNEDGVLVLEGVDESERFGRQRYRFETEFKSADEYVTRLYFMEMGGKAFEPPYLMGEVTYTRKS